MIDGCWTDANKKLSFALYPVLVIFLINGGIFDHFQPANRQEQYACIRRNHLTEQMLPQNMFLIII